MKKIRYIKKIGAAAAIIIVVLTAYILAIVPVIVAEDPIAAGDPVYISDVTVTLTATDDISGVAHTYYSVDPKTVPPVWTEYKDPFVVSGIGSHKIFYYSVDNAGNEEAVQTMSFIIENKDITPPKTTCTLDGELKI